MKSMAVERNSVWDGRKNNFDALRMLLALLVLASHCYPLALGSEEMEPIRRLTRGQLTGGGVAVDLFFVMSGFMIAGSMERSKSAGQFLMRRVTRIYPAFVMCMLLAFFVVAPLAHAVLLPGVLHRVGDLLLQTMRLREFTYSGAFAANPYPAQAINGAVWSIQYEFWCYLGVLLLGLSGLLSRRMLLLVTFVAAIVVSVLFLTQGWVLGGKFLGVLMGPPQFWARLLPYYLAGVVFYLFRERIPHSRGLAVMCAVLLVPMALWQVGVAALFPVVGTYLTFYLAFASWLPLHQAARFGDFSYGFYLYAFPIQQLVMQGMGHAVTPFALFAMATPLTLVAAVGSWYLVERRFLRPGRRHQSVVAAVSSS